MGGVLGTIRYQDRWKCFLPASRTSLNPPGPQEKAKNLSFRTRIFREKFGKISLLALLTPFLGTPPGRWTDREFIKRLLAAERSCSLP